MSDEEVIGTVSPVSAEGHVKHLLSLQGLNPRFLFLLCTLALTRISLRFLGRRNERIGHSGMAAKQRSDEWRIGRYFLRIWGILGSPGLNVVTKGTRFFVCFLFFLLRQSALFKLRILSKASSMSFGLYCRFKRNCLSSSSLFVRKFSVEHIRRSL